MHGFGYMIIMFHLLELLAEILADDFVSPVVYLCLVAALSFAMIIFPYLPHTLIHYLLKTTVFIHFCLFDECSKLFLAVWSSDILSEYRGDFLGGDFAAAGEQHYDRGPTGGLCGASASAGSTAAATAGEQ